MDRWNCEREVKACIEYGHLCTQFNREDVDEMVELITDVLCTTRPTIRIGGEDIPAEQARERFQRLDCGHLEYVFDCLRRNTTQVRNIRAYLLTALITPLSPSTITTRRGAARFFLPQLGMNRRSVPYEPL